MESAESSTGVKSTRWIDDPSPERNNPCTSDATAASGALGSESIRRAVCRGTGLLSTGLLDGLDVTGQAGCCTASSIDHDTLTSSMDLSRGPWRAACCSTVPLSSLALFRTSAMRLMIAAGRVTIHERDHQLWAQWLQSVQFSADP